MSEDRFLKNFRHRGRRQTRGQRRSRGEREASSVPFLCDGETECGCTLAGRASGARSTAGEEVGSGTHVSPVTPAKSTGRELVHLGIGRRSRVCRRRGKCAGGRADGSRRKFSENFTFSQQYHQLRPRIGEDVSGLRREGKVDETVVKGRRTVGAQGRVAPRVHLKGMTMNIK